MREPWHVLGWAGIEPAACDEVLPLVADTYGQHADVCAAPNSPWRGGGNQGEELIGNVAKP